MSRMRIAFCGLLLFALAGCSKQPEQTQTQPPPQQPPAQQEPAAQTPPATQAESAAPQAQQPAAAPAQAESRQAAAKPASAPKPRAAAAAPAGTAAQPAAAVAPAAAPAPPPPRIVDIPAGTKLSIRLADPLDTGVNKTGDSFQGILDEDLVVNGIVAAPRGSEVTGKVTDLKQSGRVQGLAQMSISLKQITIRNTPHPIQTETLSFQGESTKKKDAAKVGIGAGIGAAIGAIAGGGKGAAIGAAVGGGAGGATVIATRGKEIKFAPEHKFAFTLRSDLKVTVP